MRRLWLAAALAACAHAAPAPGRSAGRLLLEVPFHASRAGDCGPAALASVLNYWGVAADPAAVRGGLYRRDLGGSLSVDLMLAARERGLSAESEPGTIELLKSELDAGRPPLVFVGPRHRMFGVGHFVVVTGYDDRRGGLYGHSGRERDAFLPYGRFEERWERGGRWTLRVRR